MKNTTIFTEQQQFTQWWIWTILLGATLLPIVGIYMQIIRGIPFGDKPMSDTGLIVLMIFMVFFLLFFYTMRLTTVIDGESIYIHFFPFTKKTIPWEEVVSAEVINYGFVGGWGIRLGSRYGTVYNISGNKGLFLKLKSGKKYCIGTQKRKKLESVIEQIHLKHNLKSGR